MRTLDVSRRTAALLIVVALTLAATALGACGGDDEDSGSEPSAAADESAPEVPYDGVEAELPTEYPEPKAGGGFTIGWMNPFSANESLSAQQDAVEIEVRRLGGKTIALDDQLDVDRQVSNFKQLLSQDVDAIGFFPIDAEATAPVLAEARRAGVPVLAIEKTQDPKEPAGDVATQVWQGRDTQAYRQAQHMAKLNPGAKIGVIGIGAPVPALKYWAERAQFWAKEFGLSVEAFEEDPSGDAAGGEKAMNALVAKAPDMEGVIAYNDSVAIAAAAVARASGVEADVVALNGQSDGLEAVGSERLAATFQLDSVGIGTEAARALWTLAGDPDAKLPEVVVRPPTEAITSDNIEQFKTWDEQVEDLKAGAN